MVMGTPCKTPASSSSHAQGLFQAKALKTEGNLECRTLARQGEAGGTDWEAGGLVSLQIGDLPRDEFRVETICPTSLLLPNKSSYKCCRRLGLPTQRRGTVGG